MDNGVVSEGLVLGLERLTTHINTEEEPGSFRRESGGTNREIRRIYGVLDPVAKYLALLPTVRADRRKRSHRATSLSTAKSRAEVLLSARSRRSGASSGALSHLVHFGGGARKTRYEVQLVYHH
jgi:hypothetical protein